MTGWFARAIAGGWWNAAVGLRPLRNTGIDRCNEGGSFHRVASVIEYAIDVYIEGAFGDHATNAEVIGLRHDRTGYVCSMPK